MDVCEDVSYSITKQLDSDGDDDSDTPADGGDTDWEAPPHPKFLWSVSNENHALGDCDVQPVYQVTVCDISEVEQGVTETHNFNGDQFSNQDVNPECLCFAQSEESARDETEENGCGCMNTVLIKQEPFDTTYSIYEQAAENSNESNGHFGGCNPGIVMDVKQESSDLDFHEATLRSSESGGNISCTGAHLNFIVKEEEYDQVFSDSDQTLCGFNDLQSEEGIHFTDTPKRCKLSLDTSEHHVSPDTCVGEGLMEINLEPKLENSENYLYGESLEKTKTNSQCSEASDGQGLHNSTLLYVCDFNCGKSFRKRSQYSRHLRSHTAARPYKCKLCPKDFASHSRLQVHIRTHTGERPFSCSKCGKSFATKGTLNRHRVTHSEKKPQLCTVCNKLFPSADGSGLATHWEKEHKGQRPYQCNTCSMEFDNISSFISHHKMHGDTRERLFACDVCAKTFTDQRILSLHKQLHGSSNEYMCTECGERFTEHSQLLTHYKTHMEEKPYKCGICERVFDTKGHLVYHQASHGEYANKCDRCGKQVTQSISQHWLEDHPGEKPFQCSVCNQEFVNINSFIQHSKLAHKFQCKVCKKEFNTKGMLVQHHESSSCGTLDVKSAS